MEARSNKEQAEVISKSMKEMMSNASPLLGAIASALKAAGVKPSAEAIFALIWMAARSTQKTDIKLPLNGFILMCEIAHHLAVAEETGEPATFIVIDDDGDGPRAFSVRLEKKPAEEVG